MYLNGLFGLSPEQTQQRDALVVAVYNNMALCHLKGGQFKKVVDDANRVLALDKDNSKALFRRGSAQLRNGNLDAAERDLERANAVAPDRATADALAQLKVARAAQDKKSSVVYAKMFQ
jgi:tetratricopeptide (TPR) repeat protein